MGTTFRDQIRAGANGGRIRLSPQKYWDVNNQLNCQLFGETWKLFERSLHGSQSDERKFLLQTFCIRWLCQVLSRRKTAGHEGILCI